MKKLIILLLIIPSLCFATSDTFPPTADRPVIADFLSSPNNTYYCSPTGNNSSGDGSIGDPWLDLRGAQGTISAGDLLYLRGGTYPDINSQANYSRSDNHISTNGTSENPIVISNYPGETVIFDEKDTWVLSLIGSHQKLIGTMNGAAYGIQTNSPIGIGDDNTQYVQISNIEFSEGGDGSGDLNTMMLGSMRDVDHIIVSHNYFHDSDFYVDTRMACLKFFYCQDILIEYNLFEDNPDLNRGAIELKDTVDGAIIRYNTFINNGQAAIAWGIQGNSTVGLDIYENLSYSDKFFIWYQSDNGNSDSIEVYNNVALSLDTAFLLYFNADNDTYTAPWNMYDNLIDGSTAYMRDHENSDDFRNMPDLWDYNLWTNTPNTTITGMAPNTSADISSLSFFSHAQVSADLGVTYSSETYTVTADDDYPGLGEGKTGGNIGGFEFTPTQSQGISITGGTIE